MLYSNKELRVVEKAMSFGSLAGVTLGEAGRGRREVFLPTPPELRPGDTIKGARSDLSIGLSKTGRPRIITRKPTLQLDGMYLCLSSQQGYTRRGDGRVLRYKLTPSAQLVAWAMGADGDAGRIGNWEQVLVSAHDGDIYAVNWSGHRTFTSPTIYVVLDGTVYFAEANEVDLLFEQLGRNMPFKIAEDEWGNSCILPREWEPL